MESEIFDKIIAKRVGECLNTLCLKSKEYATEDRLHNFKRGAEIMRCAPEQALFGFLTKHLVSIVDIVEDIERYIPTERLWDEKVGDALCYLLLLDALMKERMNKNV